MKRYFLLLIVLVVTSPFVWQLVAQPGHYSLTSERLYSFSDPAFVGEVNSMQGQLASSDFAGLRRIVANKYVHMAHLILNRSVEGWDANFLYLSGDINPNRSNQKIGELMLVTLPLFVFGIYTFRPRLKWVVLYLFIGMSLFAGVFNAKYFVTPRIPILLLILIISANGLKRLLFGKNFFK